MSKQEKQQIQNKEDNGQSGLSRRDVMKLGTVGAISGVGAMLPVKAHAREDGYGIVYHDTFPLKVSPDYKRFREGDQSFHRFRKKGLDFTTPPKVDSNAPGYDAIDYAMKMGADEVAYALDKYSTAYGGLPEVRKPAPIQDKVEFVNAAVAHAKIKRAARLMGAQLVGITRRDPRWDYSHLVDWETGTEPVMEEALGFEPKTVIVLGFEMDYEAYTTGPSAISDAASCEGYSSMAKTSLQMAASLSYMGYHSVATGNGVGLSVPYAIAAGLGESNRMGLVQNYKYASRFRIAKVYTDLELDEYFDKPVTFGVQSFCENCLHCADQCPSKAVSRDKKPSMAPPSDGKDRGFNNPGVYKWYVDCDKCLQYWQDSGTFCGTCISTCPYSKPHFWHHRLIDKANTILPGFMHKFMADMDLLHGYGDTFDEKAPAVFWENADREYNGMKG